MSTGSAQGAGNTLSIGDDERKMTVHNKWWSTVMKRSSPDFPGLDTLSTRWLALAHDADSVGLVDDTHGPRLSFPTVLIALRVTRHYLRHLGKKYMIRPTSLQMQTFMFEMMQHAFLSTITNLSLCRCPSKQCKKKKKERESFH